MTDWKKNPAVLVVGIIIIIIALVFVVISVLPKPVPVSKGMVKCAECTVQYPLSAIEAENYTDTCPECEGTVTITTTTGNCSECGEMMPAAEENTTPETENTEGQEEE